MWPQAETSFTEYSRFWRRTALAPACLLLVAGVQFVRVRTCDQTPWKGGGFGMFSTVDAETARFTRCYLVTPGGDLPVAVPASLRQGEARLRAAPTAANLKAMAEKLAALRWRPKLERTRSLVAGIRSLPPGTSITKEYLHPPGAAPRVNVANTNDPPELEPIDANDISPNSAIPFSAVRVEAWRYQFAAATRALTAVPIRQVTLPIPIEESAP